MYPLTTAEIAGAQQADATYKHLFKYNAVIDQGLEICYSYGINHKPTTVKNPQANAILECMHQGVLGQMLRTLELDMADSISPDDFDVFPHQKPDLSQS